jgi:hypothetical protein
VLRSKGAFSRADVMIHALLSVALCMTAACSLVYPFRVAVTSFSPTGSGRLNILTAPAFGEQRIRVVVHTGGREYDISGPLQQINLDFAEIAWSEDSRFAAVLICDGYRPQWFAYDLHERRKVSPEPLRSLLIGNLRRRYAGFGSEQFLFKPTEVKWACSALGQAAFGSLGRTADGVLEFADSY